MHPEKVAAAGLASLVHLPPTLRAAGVLQHHSYLLHGRLPYTKVWGHTCIAMDGSLQSVWVHIRWEKGHLLPHLRVLVLKRCTDGPHVLALSRPGAPWSVAP